jgi:hypothetical protein
MKAAFRNYEQWEEENWLRLYFAYKNLRRHYALMLRYAWLIIQLAVFLGAQIVKAFLLMLRLLLLSEPQIARIERNEEWIFKHVK